MRESIILLLGIILFSCNGKIPVKTEKKDFRFTPTEGLYVTILKCEYGKYYMMLSQDSLSLLSDSIDYIEFQAHAMGPINIVLDPDKKKDIYILESEYLKKYNIKNYDLHLIDNSTFDSLFFEPRIRTLPRRLKYPYIHIWISTETYSIVIDRYEIVQTWLKTGNVYEE